MTEIGCGDMRAKAKAQTTFLLELLDDIPGDQLEIITPRDPDARGGQLSLLTREDGRPLFASLQESGIICDFRRPNVIRVATAPLYNSYEDLWHFADKLRASLQG